MLLKKINLFYTDLLVVFTVLFKCYLNIVYYTTERNQEISKQLTLFLKRNSQHRIQYLNYVSKAEALVFLDRRPLGINLVLMRIWNYLGGPNCVSLQLLWGNSTNVLRQKFCKWHVALFLHRSCLWMAPLIPRWGQITWPQSSFNYM